MKKIIIIITMLILLVTACSDRNVNTNENTENINNNTVDIDEKDKSDSNDNIDRTEYLTGEIITDGIYNYPLNHKGIIYFVPDEESSIIIKEKYDAAAESFQLLYDDMSKVKNFPKELGIFKVKVDIDWNEKGRSFLLNDIQLTDKIGTVTYTGKTYETNELDENVKVKDEVCGLIVKWISRDKDTGGIQIRFAGEIESEGYFSINYSEMYDDYFGRIHFDKEYFANIPMYVEKGFNNFYFAKANKLFDQLKSFSSFGRGRFKTSNYHLVYNVGMGRPASDYLTEIISLDENYNNMFELDKNKYVGTVGVDKDFIIVSSANYDESFNYLSTDLYYINKNKPEKIFLFNSLGYNYELKLTASENEFILSTNGSNSYTGEQNEDHTIICKITEDGVTTEKTEDLSIDLNKIDDTDITDFYSLFSKAQEAWGWFYVDTMPLKGTPGLPLIGIMTESGECFEVDYEGIETLKDLENYLKTIFSDEKVEYMLKTERYFDVDGKLCAIVMSRGTNHSYGIK